jgi:hypothetical protein
MHGLDRVGDLDEPARGDIRVSERTVTDELHGLVPTSE